MEEISKKKLHKCPLRLNIDDLVSAEKQTLIKDAAKTFGKESFKTLKENLPENISYGEIRMVMSAEIADE